MPVEYEMIVANSVLHTLLFLYHLISNMHSWKNSVLLKADSKHTCQPHFCAITEAYFNLCGSVWLQDSRNFVLKELTVYKINSNL